MNHKLKGKISKLKGHQLEEHTYQTIKKTTQTQHNYTNINVKRPNFYKEQPYHQKKYIEIDNMFYYNNKLFIIQCKRRRGVSKTGKTNSFWVKNKNTNELYFDGKKKTGEYLDNLWKAKSYIKYHKIYKLHGKPKIITVLLLDSLLRSNNELIKYALVRGTYVISKSFLNTFLFLIVLNKMEKTLKNEISISSGNQGEGVLLI